MQKKTMEAFLSALIVSLCIYLCLSKLVMAEENRSSIPSSDIDKTEKLSENGVSGKNQRHGNKRRGENGKKKKDRPFPPPRQAWNVATIILGCPSDKQITLSITAEEELEGYIEYGGEKTEIRKYPGKTPVQLTLNGLIGDTDYPYHFRYRKPGENEFKKSPDYHFHTQRFAGSPFTFEMQGDSHPERTPKQNNPILYEQVLLSVAKDRPDFYICMGDDFSVDTLQEINAGSVARVYFKQLPYLGLVAHSSALFLVNGNHEQAALCNLDGTANNVAVLAQINRNRLFPQPAPDGFYKGDKEKVDPIGLLRDYYAWIWGDALFVVIDPYWHSREPVDNPFGGDKKHRDLWEVTLGEEQYKWLKATLEGSKAKFKFVFSHHVLGTGRGGIEEADLFEWGGRNKQGDDEFKKRRPGWELPIHPLMVKNKVNIFFQGHDHIFAKQEKDGVVYQTLPDPANSHYPLFQKEETQQAYQSGKILPSSGRVRVSVTPEKVLVEYIRSYLPEDRTPSHPDGEVAYSYTLNPMV